MFFSKPNSRRRVCAKAMIGKTVLQGRHRSLRIEPLERRTMLNAVAVFDHILYHPNPLASSGATLVASSPLLGHPSPLGSSGVTPAASSPPSTAFTPSQIQTAYGISAISLGSVAGTGSGQTIAIVDAYEDPNIVGDTAAFSTQFDLQQFNVPGGPTLTVLNQTGGVTPPTASGTTGWSQEESLDVEWAHAIAPQANIVLFEADSDSMSDMLTAVQTAAAYSGVSTVSMSWGSDESLGENSGDFCFTTPAGHAGVTFLAATGDSGSPGEYPAYSPNVVAAGGTTLSLNADNTYKSEVGWSDSGGGQSSFETEPSYQEGVQNSGWRQIPDVAFDADPNTGVAVYDSYDAAYDSASYGTTPWQQFGGTSLASPCWAGLIAIADQLRASQGLGSLDGASQTLPALYALDAADFHDVTSGSNGAYTAGAGYDMVTGLGTPIADKLVPDLALNPSGTLTSPATTVSLTASTNAAQYSQPITFSVTVDKTDPGVAPPTGTVTFLDGGTTIDTATLVRGMALFTDSSLALGSHSIAAVYGGDATFSGSTSSAVVEIVSPLATITSLSASASSSTYGKAETLTATIRGVAPGAAAPAGTVTFTDQATSATLGTATLTAGTAAITIDSLTAGGHEIVATYAGDGPDILGSSTGLALGPIGTIAGNGLASYSGDGGQAADAQLDEPYSIAVDAAGDLFIADTANNCIREVNAGTHVITTVAGNGTAGNSGDGGPATDAELNGPYGIAVDAAGDLFIADTNNDRIREVDAGTHVITTVAGNGAQGYGGDGGPATGAVLYWPVGIAVDAAGDLYIAEYGDNRVREVNSSTQVITTVAGNGTAGYSGDGGQATGAELNSPFGLAVDAAGDLFIADSGNNCIREVNAGTHVITTVAGNGTAGNSGDGGQATSAELYSPFGIAVDAGGDLLIADSGNNCIREINAGTQVISTVAGNGSFGYSGDGGPVINAELAQPAGLAVNVAGDLFIADTYNSRIREVNASTQVITTVAGGGLPNDAPAADVSFAPLGIAVDAAGDQFIADTASNCVCEVSAATGVITTVAGNGIAGYGGDGGPAADAELDAPWGVAVDSAGDLFIADTGNNCIREVNAGTHVITTIAGNPSISGYGGDGGPATDAILNHPTGLAVDSAGDLFIADTYNCLIREINASTHVISTVAGNGWPFYGGDGGPATDAELCAPYGVAVDAAGDLFIADTFNNCVREVAAGTQIITTVAGTGAQGYSGDTGPATDAQLYDPTGVAVNAYGDLFIADYGNNCIREVNASTQVIATVAGNGTSGYNGDRGAAVAVELADPESVALDAAGNLFIADTGNYRVREAAAPTFTVTPATLTVTANSTSKTYGQTLSFAGTEFTASGLVSGDSVTRVTLASAGAAASAAVGIYPISSSAAVGSGLNNYTINYVSGTLTVDTPVIVPATQWTTPAGLTLALGSDNNLHVYTTGTNSDVVASYPQACVTNVEIASPSGDVGNLTIDSTGDPIPAGGLTYSGDGGLIITGSGTVILSGANTYTGGTVVSSGTLVINCANAIPDTSLTVGSVGAFIFEPNVSSDFAALSTATTAASTATWVDATAATSTVTSNGDAAAAKSAPASAGTSNNTAFVAAVASVASSHDATAATAAPLATSAASSNMELLAPGAPQPRHPVAARALNAPVQVRVVWSSTAKRAVGDLAWLEQAANNSDNSDQQRKKDVAILALDAVFAKYGQ